MAGDSEDPGIRPDKLDFIFEYVRGAPERQYRDIDALDTKALGLLSVASLVIGLAGFSLIGDVSVAAAVIIAAATVAFGWVGWWTLRALGVRTYRLGTHADVLWPRYWSDDPATIKHALVADIGEAYAHNRRHLTEKASALRLALRGLVAEVVLVGVALAISHLSVVTGENGPSQSSPAEEASVEVAADHS